MGVGGVGGSDAQALERVRSGGGQEEGLDPGTENAPAIAAAYSGLGVAVMPHAFVQDEIDDGFLVTPFAFTYQFKEAFYLVCPEASAERPKIEAFRHWLLGEAAKEDAGQRARRGGGAVLGNHTGWGSRPP